MVYVFLGFFLQTPNTLASGFQLFDKCSRKVMLFLQWESIGPRNYTIVPQNPLGEYILMKSAIPIIHVSYDELRWFGASLDRELINNALN